MAGFRVSACTALTVNRHHRRDSARGGEPAATDLVQVFEFDQVDGRYYIAMELVRGRTLREVVDRCRELGVRFGLARAVHVCAELARALGYAHRLEDGGRPAGLVHRDVSHNRNYRAA